MVWKSDVFKEELSWIKDDSIRNATMGIIQELPDYFFTVAASSTGKYHPKYALGNGGLVRHTKAAAKILHELAGLEHNRTLFSEEEIDLMISAIILHDGFKHGQNGSEYTVSEHPLIMAEYIKNNHKDDFSGKQLKFITEVISSHMGEFNKDFRTKAEILPKPANEAQYFVHLADYLASRRYLVFEFDDYYDPDNYVPVETEDDVNSLIQQIVAKCKEFVANGADRGELYELIGKYNNGQKNPLMIKDSSIAKDILNKLIERKE